MNAQGLAAREAAYGGGRADETALAPKVRRLGGPLLNLQCWCWGCDIRRAAGNLLLAYGADRRRPPEGRQGSSAYSFAGPDGSTVIVWGWGCWYGDGGGEGVFLPRQGFAPGLTAARPPCAVCLLPDLPPARQPGSEAERRRLKGLLSGCCAWIGGYERWVIGAAGADYRRECVEAWRQRPAARPACEESAPALAERWHALRSLIG